jgi:hypothetical protein
MAVNKTHKIIANNQISIKKSSLDIQKTEQKLIIGNRTIPINLKINTHSMREEVQNKKNRKDKPVNMSSQNKMRK